MTAEGGSTHRQVTRAPQGILTSTCPAYDAQMSASQRGIPPLEPIPVYRPSLGSREREALLDAFDSGWISGRGPQIEAFEDAFAQVVGSRAAVAVSNGSVALHLVLSVLGLGAGDEVIVPSYTYVACANAIAHTGARPVLADSSPQHLQAEIDHVISRITPRTRAVILPYLFGYPLNARSLAVALHERGIALIEDCSEALGSRVNGRHVGNLGAASTYSFFGNKTITTGEGGMVTTNDSSLAEQLRVWRNQGVGDEGGFAHEVAGFNYRMTNLQAAIGEVQLSRLGEFIARKRQIADFYGKSLTGLPLRLITEPAGSHSSYWLCTGVLDAHIDRFDLMSHASAHGVDLRPGFIPMHHLPMYREGGACLPGTEEFHARVVCLPSFPTITDGELQHVASALKGFLQARTSGPDHEAGRHGGGSVT